MRGRSTRLGFQNVREVGSVNSRNQVANQLFATPILLITLLSSERQWFKSKQGIEIDETPRSWAFCSYAIMKNDVFMVADAKEDAYFKNNPLVLASPYIRFYADVLIVRQGLPSGSLCVTDREPRILRSSDRQALTDLAGMATDLIQLRWHERSVA